MRHAYVWVHEAVDEDLAGEEVQGCEADEFGLAGFGGAHFAVEGYGGEGGMGMREKGSGVVVPVEGDLGG